MQLIIINVTTIMTIAAIDESIFINISTIVILFINKLIIK